MGGSRVVVALAVLLPAAIVAGCSDQVAPTESSSRSSFPTSVAMGVGNGHAGAIISHDTCDPESFNAAVGDGTCVKPGPTTFDAFIAELVQTQTARTWRFNPLQPIAHAGEALLVRNVGGEPHTFTPVRQFGGGFIPDLNGLSGNPVPAPECLNIPALDFVPSGGQSLISAAALASVADNGIARIECCLHPWMRAEVQLK